MYMFPTTSTICIVFLSVVLILMRIFFFVLVLHICYSVCIQSVIYFVNLIPVLTLVLVIVSSLYVSLVLFSILFLIFYIIFIIALKFITRTFFIVLLLFAHFSIVRKGCQFNLKIIINKFENLLIYKI